MDFFSSVQNNLHSRRWLIRIYATLDVADRSKNFHEEGQKYVSLFVGRTCTEDVVHEKVREVCDDVCLEEGVDERGGVGPPAEQLEELGVLNEVDVVMAALECPDAKHMERAVVDDVQSLTLAKKVDRTDLKQYLSQHEPQFSQVEDEAALQQQPFCGPGFEAEVAQIDALADVGHVLAQADAQLVAHV